jgi:hypothetical protein
MLRPRTTGARNGELRGSSPDRCGVLVVLCLAVIGYRAWVKGF